LRWYRQIASLLRNLLHRGAAEQEIEAELNSYIEEQAERNQARGVKASDALRQARLEAGGVQQVKEKVLSVHAGFRLQILVQDLGYAFRRIAQKPA
jgi:hypothetical protein